MTARPGHGLAAWYGGIMKNLIHTFLTICVVISAVLFLSFIGFAVLQITFPSPFADIIKLEQRLEDLDKKFEKRVYKLEKRRYALDLKCFYPESILQDRTYGYLNGRILGRFPNRL